MGIRRERLRRKTASGTYDTIHLETSADIVLMSDGSGLLEDELAKVKPIEKGGTGSSTADEALRSLINGCETLDKAEAGDWFFVLDKDAQTVKKISLEELKKFSGGSGGSEEPEEPVTNPNWPDKSQLTLGNTITWANKEWIVVHVTSTEVYLTLKHLDGRCTFFSLQRTASTWSNEHFTNEQLQCLKRVVADTTNGKVFVATRDQMNGGFSYFNSNSRRDINDVYWTSTGNNSDTEWYVFIDGSFQNYYDFIYDNSDSYGFRPSVCVDLTLYE